MSHAVLCVVIHSYPSLWKWLQTIASEIMCYSTSLNLSFELLPSPLSLSRLLLSLSFPPPYSLLQMMQLPGNRKRHSYYNSRTSNVKLMSYLVSSTIGLKVIVIIALSILCPCFYHFFRNQNPLIFPKKFLPLFS